MMMTRYKCEMHIFFLPEISDNNAALTVELAIFKLTEYRLSMSSSENHLKEVNT